MPLASLEERERKLRIVEQRLKSEFWKIISESSAYVNAISCQDVVEMHFDGKHEEAKRLAFQIKAKQQILTEPMSIVRTNKPIFDRWDGKQWVKKKWEEIRQFVGRDSQK